MPSPRLLFIDDNENRLSLYESVLTLAGYETKIAHNVVEGLTLLESESFALVVSGLRIADIPGLELLSEARERAPHVPVIIFAASGSQASERAARHLGAVDFVSESPAHEMLLTSIKRHVAAVSATDRRRTCAPSEPIGPATRRWVGLVIGVTQASSDLRTLTHWAGEVHHSVTTLKRSCFACGVQASDSLDFARVLRLAVRHPGQRINWYDMVEICDPRTLASFLVRAGLVRDQPLPGAHVFLYTQHFVNNSALIRAVESAL